MAGIGFELKKLFSKKGLILRVRANLYASLVVAGPMLLGIVLLLGTKIISRLGNATIHHQDMIMVFITYPLLFSLLLSSTILFVLARYIADMMYINADDRILPSMYGSISVLLVIGGLLWFVFLYFSRLELVYSVLSFILFCEGVVVWVQINYITAVKDYRGILLGFVIGIAVGLMSGFLLMKLKYDIVAALLAGACIAYGVLIIDFTVILHKFFPTGSGNPLKFLEWIDEYPQLPLIGFFSTLALFVHIMLMWWGPLGVQVEGLFYHAPSHDIPALLAFLTSLMSTVNFVTFVEVNFYPTYRRYFALLNGDGSLSDVEKAYDEMMTVLKQELFYLAIQQVFVTIFAVVMIGELLVYFGLGFTSNMIGIFRVLSIGYGLYAIGNSLTLFLLYFSSNTDALWATVTLLVCNFAGTLYTLTLPEVYYGFGFVAACAVFYLVALQRLFAYTARLDFYIFTRQPVFFVRKKGLLTRLVQKLEA